MGKKKSNSVNAARLLESKIAPIVEVNFVDPLFSVSAHPSRPILACGLATGHVFCYGYDAEKLEDSAVESRETIKQEEKEAAKKSTSVSSVRSVSQTKKKWWQVVGDHTDVPEDSLVKTMWKTKRHKGSCRSVIFDPLENSVGESIFTVGTDHIIKKADTETGRVTGKVSVVKDFYEPKDAITKIVHSTSHPFLVAGTENGHVLIYDSKNMGKNEIKYKVHQAHDDSINHILAMPAVSAYHYLTLGSTTLSHIDIRKGIITQSDDQEDELLSMCFATDQVTENKNDTVLVSHGEGLVTLWKNSKNHWRDQISRIKVNKGVSIDAIVPTMNCNTDEMASSVWCGDSEGLLHRINYKRGKVVETRVHSTSTGKYGAVDEVGGLDIDCEYRLVSVGMDSLKIWLNRENEDENIVSDEESDSDSDDESDDGSSQSDDDDSSSERFTSDSESNSGSDNEVEVSKDVKSDLEENLDNDVSDDDVDSSDENAAIVSRAPLGSSDNHCSPSEPQRPKRIFASKPKRKLISLNDKTEILETSEKKPKKKQLTSKQLRNMQQHEHGIKRFDGL